MKINGQVIETALLQTVYIPRGKDGEEGVIFTCKPVTDFERFNALVAEPKPMNIFKPGEAPKPDTNSVAYKEKKAEYDRLYFFYMTLESLSATEGLTWDTVIADDPSTWPNIETELRTSGFSPIEVKRIFDGIMQANSLDEKHLALAKERFLAGKQVPVE